MNFDVSSLINTISGKGKVDISAMPDTSYAVIMQDLMRWRASARSDEGIFDFPGHTYFKILFHFYNKSDADAFVPTSGSTNLVDTAKDAYTGLLGPSWLALTENKDTSSDKSNQVDYFTLGQQKENLPTIWAHNTAWSYFVMNDDQRRAQYVQDFVNLLSNISSNSPWYFQAVKGLDAAIARSVVGTDEFMMKNERDRITIECLTDAYDQRIGTLLDLYRAITWSWEMKREILPSNLRKFDMTIICFQIPIKGMHVPRAKLDVTADKFARASKRTQTASIVAKDEGFALVYGDGTESTEIASYKAFEFHGCEIDYNTSKSGYDSLSNEAGQGHKFNIEIMFDDMYEIRWNEFMQRTITDMQGDNVSHSLGTDLKKKDEPDSQPYKNPTKTPTYSDPETLNINTVTGIALDLFTGGKSSNISTKLASIYLGNLYGLSLSRLTTQVNQALSGDWTATYNNVKSAVQGNYNGNKGDINPKKSLYEDAAKQVENIVNLGNIFQAQSIAKSL